MGASIFLRSIRLKVLLAKFKKLKLSDLIWLNGAALLLNFLIPVRAGEIAKAIYLNAKYKLPLAKSFIWVFLDRFVDFLTVLALTAILLFLVPTSLNITFIIVITIILSFSLILTYFAIYNVNFAKKTVIFLRPLFILNNIKIWFERFSNLILESSSILNRHPKELLIIFLITILGYAADAGIWFFAFLALGSYQDFVMMYLGQLLSALTYLIPAAPGYVGSAEASGVLILSGVFGIETNLASAMVVLFHILTAIFVLVYGILSFYLLKLDLGLIIRKIFRR